MPFNPTFAAGFDPPFALASSAEALLALAAVVTAAGVGATVPALADRVLRRSRERYRAWLGASLADWCDFWREERRLPRERSRGRERALWAWARELPRLAADGALSQSELRQIARAPAPAPFAVTQEALCRAPSEEAVEREFSLDPTPGVVAAGGLVLGTVAALLSAGAESGLAGAAGVLFAAACWLMALVDARSRTIPTACTALIAVSGIAWRTAVGWGGWEGLATSAALGTGTFALLAVSNAVARAARGREGIGGGDVRTLPVLAFVLGADGAAAGFLAAALALAAHLAARAVTGTFRLSDTIPFGPFMAVMGVAGMLCASVP